MNFQRLLELLAFLQFFALSQNSRVQKAKQHIRTEVRSALREAPAHFHYEHFHSAHGGQQHRVHRVHTPRRQRWHDRYRSLDHHQHAFTRWTQWTPCSADCVRRRERYCKAKRKCGYTKHVEERKCWRCSPPVAVHQAHTVGPQQSSNAPPSIVINAAAAAASGVGTAAPAKTITFLPAEEHHPHFPPPSYVDVVHSPSHEYEDGDDADSSAESDFYVLRTRRRIKPANKPPPIEIDEDDFAESLQDSRETKAAPSRYHKRREKRRRPTHQRDLGMRQGDFGFEGDIFQYEDFDLEHDQTANLNRGFEPDNQYVDSFEDSDYGEYQNISSQWHHPSKERATNEALIPRHRRVYSKWSRWTKCSSKCTTRRYKKCRVREQCGREVLREIAYCYTEGSFCQQWLQAELQKSPAYDLRPVTATRRMNDESSITNNAIVGDYIMNSKGYRGPEYTPMKIKCGIAPIRSNRRNMYNMLKIIGGKESRRGEWPWQVAIFNRFKEAFCGGTLIAPNWVLTAAHCVRKVLYVRIGEHNLDKVDGSEIQLRVLKSYKHPNFDKKTVDSDVALLRLPKPINATTWIGFSCLPRPYQPLPKNVDCTVIGWGKQRHRDVTGTNILHQAEVPIIPKDNCHKVYHEYTITKNMFCAGHKRGRIDTCAGDSGGPLLCRDTTKPNHPWTIFGITSFGDGCAKRNKFGIYAKVPNYVDWVWSVINCNGNCKLH